MFSLPTICERFELDIKKAAIRGFFSSRVVQRVQATAPATPFATTTAARVSL